MECNSVSGRAGNHLHVHTYTYKISEIINGVFGGLLITAVVFSTLQRFYCTHKIVILMDTRLMFGFCMIVKSDAFPTETIKYNFIIMLSNTTFN